LKGDAAIAATGVDGKHQFFECEFIFLADLALGLLVRLGEIKLLIILGDSCFSKEYLSEALPPHSGQELDLPELPIILLSTESNDLEAFLFYHTHLEVSLLVTIKLGFSFIFRAIL